MIKSIINSILIMHQVSFFPEVGIAALSLYFISKQWLGINPKISVWVPIFVSFGGNLGVSWPKTSEETVMNLLFGAFQAAMAVGIYSIADKYKLMDIIGIGIKNKLRRATQKK